MNESRICLALDGLSLDVAVNLTKHLGPRVYAVKIHDLYDKEGAHAVIQLKKAGAERIWVDAKLHDIPSTVAARARAIARNGADIISAHIPGGKAMVEAAIDAMFETNVLGEIWGITLLTSLDQSDLDRDYGQYGGKPTAEQIVLNRVRIGKEAGLKTIVCSAQEVGLLSKLQDVRDMQSVVPGTRSTGVALGSQKRSTTPAEAIQAGTWKLVVASQVTSASDPVAAFDAFEAEVTNAT